MKRKERSTPEKQSHDLQNHLANPNKMNRMDTNEKDEKYDRQLRLWGHNGQYSLEHAHVCLLNVTAAGTEALKCLILPGIGKYSIVDHTLCTTEDVGKNFFLDSNSIGKPKAEIACQLLQELNPDTTGSFLNADPIELLDDDPEYFKRFTLVISSRLSEHKLLKLSNFLWHANVPLVISDNFGYFGVLRVVVKEHVIVEAHPDNALHDLRLDHPFPELVQYMDNINLDVMDKLEHSHTPYLILLFKYLEKWRKLNHSDWPKSYQEKCDIKDLLREAILKNEYGVEIIEENFEEAIQNVNNALTGTKVPNDVQIIIDDVMANHPLKSEIHSNFWILVRALKEFVNQKEVLPLRGTLPDMFSDSKRYIELQNLYKTKANSDYEIIQEFVQEALNDLQLPTSLISGEDVKSFCKNAFFIKAQQGLSVHDEFKQDVVQHKIKSVLEQATDICSDIYLIYRSICRFGDCGRFPVNCSVKDKQNDVNKIKNISSILIKEIGLEKSVPAAYIEEAFRCNVSELHTTAAIMGGLCAQEVIKLITKQFVPVDNMYIYDGISHQTTTIKL